ncbi:hypothetical protein V6N13_030562 [Hibiscus sabdariffa]
MYSRQSGHVSAAHAPRTGVQQQTATVSFRFLGVIHARGCSFCHGDTGSRVTGTRRGRGAMKRPHPLPLMFDNMFTGRSARQVSTMILPQDWVICAPAAFLGCGSRFSAPSPESNPNSPSPVTTIVGHYPTIES